MCLVILSALTPARSFAADSAAKPATCTGSPNPKGDFVANFSNACYALTLTTGSGLSEAGDSNATYDQVYYQVTPGYELVILGTFPNARFLSASVYDSHLVTTDSKTDQNILPLNSTMRNPFVVGGTYLPKQTYGLTVSFGGTLTPTPTAGCSASDSTIDQNVMNASQIHQGLSWNGWIGPPPLPDGFAAHQTGTNSAGLIMIRKYVDISQTGPETVIVRNLSTGCALLASQAVALNIVSLSQGLNSVWLNQPQISDHRTFSTTIEPTLCFPNDPRNGLQWFRTADYQPIANSVSDDIQAAVTTTQLQSLIASQSFIQIQFPYPSVPSIPCSTGSCSLTGHENMRYFSIALRGPPGTNSRLTIASIADLNLVKDANGNVNLVIGLGATPPATLTAANGYTYWDLSANPNLGMLQQIYIRNILVNASFQCSNGNVPFYTMEYNPLGGYMGTNVPVVSFPVASQIPAVPPLPLSRRNSCLSIPAPPTACN